MLNMFKTFLLLFGMTLLFMFLGERLGGTQGMVIALIIAVVLNFGSYWFSDKLVLAMYRARDPQLQERRVVTLVERLTNQVNMPMPQVKVMDEQVPNAFATGRNPQHAVVAVTTGLLAILNERELSAVLAHELCHVRNRDILIGAVVATLAGAIILMARFSLFFGGDRDRNLVVMLASIILAPIAAILIQMAVSRSREYAADRSAGLLTKRPGDLITALEKLHMVAKRHPMPERAGAEATAHMFIVNPFKPGGLRALFSTHPTLEQRTARLRKLEQEI